MVRPTTVVGLALVLVAGGLLPGCCSSCGKSRAAAPPAQTWQSPSATARAGWDNRTAPAGAAGNTGTTAMPAYNSRASTGNATPMIMPPAGAGSSGGVIQQTGAQVVNSPSSVPNTASSTVPPAGGAGTTYRTTDLPQQQPPPPTPPSMPPDPTPPN